MRRVIALAVITVSVIIDQLLKIAAESHLTGSEGFMIDGFIALRYARNTGAAFSILQDKTTLLAIISGIVLLIGIIMLMSGKIKDKLLYSSIILVVSGGLGNLYDRIFRGYVIDYIDPLFVNFAIFNFADCLVTVGAFMLIADLIMDIVREQKKKRLES